MKRSSSEPEPVADLSRLSGLAPELASAFALLASDIALVLDADGVIRTVAESQAPIAGPGPRGNWVGRSLADTVTGATRAKIESLLQEVRASGVSRRREVSHPTTGGNDIPVAYTAVRLGAHGPVLAVGRDLRAVAAIQQRFMDAQQEMERSYWRLRQEDSRYRLLFQVATDAVIVVDAATLLAIDANDAACRMFQREKGELVGQRLDAGFDAGSRPAVEELLASARSSGRAAEIRVRLMARAAAVDLSATPFRAEASQLLLVRLRDGESRAQPADAGRVLADYVRRSPDAVAITDSSGRVVVANPAFSRMCGVAGGSSGLAGMLLADALGNGGGALPQILARVRGLGIVSEVIAGGSRVQGALEVSAALLAEGDQEYVGFTFRPVENRPADLLLRKAAQNDAFDDLTAQIGLLSLPELLLEAGRRAESTLISAAIARAKGDSAAGADLLGISNENLMLRARRLGLPFSEPVASRQPKSTS